MTTFNQGEIVLVPFPFTNLEEDKRRPAVVVSAKWFNDLRHDRILLAITSQIPRNKEEDELMLVAKDIRGVDLRLPSIVRLGKIFTIETNLIVKSIDHLSPQGLEKTMSGLERVLKS